MNLLNLAIKTCFSEKYLIIYITKKLLFTK